MVPLLVVLLLAPLGAQDKKAKNAPPPQAAPAPIEVSFDIVANVIIVKGSINGKEGRTFVLDTGAEKNFITPQAAQECGVTANGPQGTGTADLGLNGAIAKSSECAVVDAPQMRPLRQYGVDYSGALGYPFLSSFVTTFNYRDKKIFFVPVDKAPKLDKTGSKSVIIDCKFVRSLLLIESVKVNDKGPFTFLLDSGSSETVLFPDTAHANGINGTPTSSSVGQIEQLKGVTVTAGEAEAKGIDLAIFTPPQAMGLKQANMGKLDGLLGRSFFDKFLLTVDYRTKQIRLDPIDAKPEPGKKPPATKTPTKKK